MSNPFPGMDPWMEDQWGDAHHSLVTYARDQLRPQLPGGFRARVEERVYFDSDARRDEQIPGSDDPVTQGFIRIIDSRSSGGVVTLIEVLSPSNKVPGRGQDLYHQKQTECKAVGVNLVEIDLLRGGEWIVGVPLDAVPDSRRGDYRVCVWRAANSSCELYPVSLRQRLPAISVPLRPEDPDVVLDLQPLVDQAYVSGTYEDTDYTADPVPRLSIEDAAWADEILRPKGLR